MGDHDPPYEPSGRHGRHLHGRRYCCGCCWHRSSHPTSGCHRRDSGLVASRQDLFRPGNPLAPGTPDAYAQYFYDKLNPLTHLSAYAHAPEITFECAANDTHVPPDGAQCFQATLRQSAPLAAEHMRVNLIPNAGHMDTSQPTFWQNCLACFTQPRVSPAALLRNKKSRLIPRALTTGTCRVFKPFCGAALVRQSGVLSFHLPADNYTILYKRKPLGIAEHCFIA